MRKLIELPRLCLLDTSPQQRLGHLAEVWSGATLQQHAAAKVGIGPLHRAASDERTQQPLKTSRLTPISLIPFLRLGNLGGNHE